MAAIGQRGEDAPAPLDGVFALDTGPGVAGAFAARWLAALGAEVVKIEPPDGDPARRAGPFPRDEPDPEASGRFLFLNAGKRSVALDLESESGRSRFARLAERADVVIDSHPPGALAALGLGYETLASRRPSLVLVSATPFGQAGPYASIAASPLTLSALSGMMWHVGEPGRPPLAQGGDQAEYLGGVHVLGAALTGAFAALRTGRGAHFDVSLQTAGAAAVGHYTARYSQVPVQGSRQLRRPLWRSYPAADGWVGIFALPRNYARMSEAMGIPELAEASPFLTPARAEKGLDDLLRILEGWFARRTCKEVSELAREQRIPLGQVMSIREVADAAALDERDFFAGEDHPAAGALRYPGQLWVASDHGWRRGRAPRLGEHSERPFAEPADDLARPAPPESAARAGAAPLEGVRVLDLGQVWAGPYAATLLADQGADVIKIEAPGAWDPNRCVAPPPEGRETEWWNTGPYFHEYSRNKKGLSLDLRHPRGRELLARLVSESDVVVENYRADVLDKLGIGYDWLRAQRREIVLLSMAGFGKTGADRDLPAYGPIMEQTSGLAALTGYGDGRPQLASFAYGDPVAAVAGASAAVAALVQRERTGRGQHIDLAQRDAVTALLGEAFVDWAMNRREPAPQGNRRTGCAPHDAYPCRGDDHWVAIAVVDDAQWEGLRRAMGRPAWAEDPELAEAAGRWRRRDALDARIREWTGELDKREVFERCAAEGVPAGPVWKPSELLEDAQLAFRNFYEPISRQPMGTWRTHGWVWRREGAGPCVRCPAPDFAGHNREILVGRLGLSDPELAELEAAGVIADVPVGLPEI